ncbi:zuotin [Sporobolomyces salmoneus]|uniref:zuotin n=1 Tax=Sporobolomyces salmoneus TaxID=183962 RepID=UPI003180B5CB
MSHPSIITLPVALPVKTSAYKPASFSPLSAPSTSGAVFPAGPAFHAHARRILNQRSFAEDDKLENELAAQNGTQVEEEDDQDADLGGEEESRDVLEQDPRKWKEQDHYAVLGLQHLRYKATDEQIKKAHRRKVLRHHPDKKASAGGHANDDSFFKCIAKAMETLSKLDTRRQFDSVDPAIPDEFPSARETTSENFYDLWTPVFDRESRFSKTQPVPALGGPETSRAEVESFYDFWYNMDSWRSFEYEDKDAPEGADSRDEKRHQEKKNKAQRAERKKGDITRVRTLVDTALASDPRIKAFKAAEKAARDAKKGKVAGAGAAVDPAVKAEEERKQKEAEEAAKKEQAEKDAKDKVDREAAKKAKESAKKNLKKAQKAITALVTSNNYFTVPGTSPAPATVEACFAELDLLFSALEAEEVVALKTQMDQAKGPDAVKLVLIEGAKKAEPKVGEGKFKEFA